MIFTTETIVPNATWQRMSDKAQSEGLRAYRLNDDPRSWAVTSHSSGLVAYEVTILDGDLLCSCRGSMFHPYCKHRALVLEELGVLEGAGADAGADTQSPVVPDRVIAVLRAA